MATPHTVITVHNVSGKRQVSAASKDGLTSGSFVVADEALVQHV